MAPAIVAAIDSKRKNHFYLAHTQVAGEEQLLPAVLF